jgi:hypothetical protein
MATSLTKRQWLPILKFTEPDAVAFLTRLARMFSVKDPLLASFGKQTAPVLTLDWVTFVMPLVAVFLGYSGSSGSFNKLFASAEESHSVNFGRNISLSAHTSVNGNWPTTLFLTQVTRRGPNGEPKRSCPTQQWAL